MHPVLFIAQNGRVYGWMRSFIDKHKPFGGPGARIKLLSTFLPRIRTGKPVRAG